MAPMVRTEALHQFRDALRRAGGVGVVAARAGVNYQNLSTVSNGGRPVGREVAAKLRPHIVLSDEAWVALLLDPIEAGAEPAAEATP